MKSTATSTHEQNKAEPARSRAGNPLRSYSSGYLGQLAAMINSSPRVQVLAQMEGDIQESTRVQSLQQLAGAPTQLRQEDSNSENALEQQSRLNTAEGIAAQLKIGIAGTLAHSDRIAGIDDATEAPGSSATESQSSCGCGSTQGTGARLADSKQEKIPAQLAAGPAADSSRPVEQLRSTGCGEIQLKKQITGAREFADKGTLLGRMTVDFEERTKGSSAGMYGTIAFEPSHGGKPAKKIDLVQIASLTTNKKGTQQAEVDAGHRASVDKNIEETDIETSGNPEIKDMVRGGTREGFHIDLTFDKSVPRTSASAPAYESAYNAERRGGRWKDPFNIAKMSKDDTVLNEYSLRDEQVNTRKIDQDPGSNDGKGRAKKTELQDFPVSSEASIFSFQTEVEADGQSWGTASWGFTTLMNLSEEAYVNTTQGPAFQSGRTEEMEEALMNFNSLLANPGAFTSPEVLASTRRLLTSKEKSSHTQGRTDLVTMGKELYWALNRINRFSQKKSTALKMAGPHFDTAREVLKLATYYEVGDEIFSELTALCDEISRKLAEHD